jgi:hypothetical protein
VLTVKDPARGEPLFMRACGPARAIVYLRGKTYRIRGGFCYPRRSTSLRTPRRRLGGVFIGLITNPPAPPGRGLDFHWQRPVSRGGAITVDDSEIELGGIRVAASGIAVVGRELSGGWFSLYGRDSSGPKGPLVSGSWSCD